MGLITNKQMESKPSGNTWFTEPFGRGSGAFRGRVTATHNRLFYFRYTDSNGGRDDYPIGTYCPKGANGLTVAQAREKAQELSRIYRDGAKDLRKHLEAQEAARKEAAERAAQALTRRKTVRTVFDEWAKKELKPRLDNEGKRQGRKDGGKYIREQFERHVFPSVGNVAMEDVTKSDALNILDTLRENGTLRTANVVLADLKQFFSFALDREIIKTNPTATLTRKRHAGGDDVVRERHLTESEIRQLAELLPNASLAPRNAIAIKLLLATVCRIGELTTARWENVHISKDGKQRHWYIPDSKNQRDHTIHLSNFALAQFKALEALREKDCPWVFPSANGKTHLNQRTINKQCTDRQSTADAPMTKRTKKMTALALEGGKWRPHDLRRTGATLMSQLGVSTDVIHECQNHIQTDKMARVYIKDRRIAQQRLAFNDLGERLDALFKGKAPAEIKPLKRTA